MSHRDCHTCNGTGRIELVDLGDGILLTPEQARSRRAADERISAMAKEDERRRRRLRYEGGDT